MRPSGRRRSARSNASVRSSDTALAASLDRRPCGVGRRRAAEIAAHASPRSTCSARCTTTDPSVVEVAAWSCGEHESSRDAIVMRLIELAGGAADALVREAAVAALGAIGDERGGRRRSSPRPSDKPAVRRRAVLALAPFDGPDVEAAIDRALTDRDWQVRQAAEDLRRAAR